jgi:O-antigen/teichoic acid export membrane protein
MADMAGSEETSSIRAILTLFSSNLLGAVVGGAFFLSASRSFDLAEMGLYAVALSTYWIITGLLGTGLHVATVRLSTDYLTAGDLAAAAEIVTLAVLTAGALSLLMAGLSLGSNLLTAAQLFLLGPLLALVALWAGARSVQDCLFAGLLVKQQFSRASLLLSLSAATGLVSLIGMLLAGSLTLRRLLVAHAFGMGATAIVGLGFLWPLWGSGVQISTKRLRALLAYACWPALSQATVSLQTELAPFMLVALAGSAQAGLYSLGRYPVFAFGMVAASLYQYWLPTAVQQTGHGQLMRFLGSQMRLAGLVGASVLLGAVVSRPLLPWLGPNFAIAAPVFVLAALDLALLVLTRPVEAVYHGLHKPHLELVLRGSRLLFLLGTALILAPHFGAVGMAWAQVLSSFVGLGLAVWLLWRELDPVTWKRVLDSFSQG